MSNVLKNSADVCKCLKLSGIPHFIGGTSLIGIIENNYTKYTKSPYIYIYNYKIYKIIIFFIVLFFYRLIPKLKYKSGRFKFKLRKQYTIFNKSDEYYNLIFGDKKLDKYEFYSGKKYISFNVSDLDDIDSFIFHSVPLSVPKKLDKFVKKYKDNLIADCYRKYPVYLKGKTEKIAIELLDNVSKILEKNKFKYWLDAGTLLGAIRDKKLIPWDHDLDLGIVYTNDNDLDNLVADLKKQFKVNISTFDILQTKWNLGRYRCIKVYLKENVFSLKKLCLDIFVFYKEPLNEDGEIVYKYGVHYKDAYYPCNLLDELSTISFYNNVYPIPNEYVGYLERKYGESWQTPKKDWSVILEDKSLL